MLVLLAQAGTPDPISGGAGWVGAGLLGLVLGWLCFFHLPAKDKQIENILASKDKQLETFLTAKEVQIATITKDFKAALDQVLDHCEKENRKMGETVQREIARIGSSDE